MDQKKSSLLGDSVDSSVQLKQQPKPCVALSLTNTSINKLHLEPHPIGILEAGWMGLNIASLFATRRVVSQLTL